MPFGTRRRVRPSFVFRDPILPSRVAEAQKLKAIAKQGLENTSQREEPKPSAKSFVQTSVSSFSNVRDLNKLGKLSRQQRASPSVGNPDAPHPTPQDKMAIMNKSVPSAQARGQVKNFGAVRDLNKLRGLTQSKGQAQVLQIITDKVKTNIKESDEKIKALTAKGLRSQVKKEIMLKKLQLKKLRTLLKKCPTCS